MDEERILPEHLSKGDAFRLTGEACNPEEAADTNVYVVLELFRSTFTLKQSGRLPDREILTALRAIVKVQGEESPSFEMQIGPWVPLIRVSKGKEEPCE